MSDPFDVNLDLDRDFEPVDPGERALAMLVRGKNRRHVAQELGVDLASAHTIVANEVRGRTGATGTRREAVAVMHASLDDIVDRVHRALDSEKVPYDVAPLLEVTLGVQRLRAALLQAEKSPSTPTTTKPRSTP